MISVPNPQVGQIIDFGFSEYEAIEECRGLVLLGDDGDYKEIYF